MLYWSVLFLVIALVAALFGFTTVAGAAISIAKLLFFLFIAIFVVLLVLALVGGIAVHPLLFLIALLALLALFAGRGRTVP